MDLFNWAYILLKKLEFDNKTAIYGNLFVNLLIISIVSWILYFIFKKLFDFILSLIAKKSKTSFDDFLLKRKSSTYAAQLIPLYFIYQTFPVALQNFSHWQYLFFKGTTIFTIFIVLWIIRSVLHALKDFLKQQPDFSDKPIDSYIQVVMIVLWFFAVIATILILFNTSLGALLGTFGAISAIVILVFKDTILGFVASIQVSINDMVRIGDWITMEKFGADGFVIEINLATVKVRNFDNTTTTIPTYSLISDSFRNWRGMFDSNGRRIKRHILIKTSSVRFLKDEELENFKKIQLISSYIDHRQRAIKKFNTQNEIDKSLEVNGRNLTNLGLFRKYINQYLLHHPGLNKDMFLMCRHLQPTEKGIPIEIYAFTSDKRWVNHEHIMADVFDHVIASVSYFDLEIYELSVMFND